MNILFVCTGNTCRSPMAEALLQARKSDVNVQSAGVSAIAGIPASGNALKALEEKLITKHHVSQQVSDSLLQWADLVLTMTSQHKRQLIIEYPDFQDKYFTLKEYVSFDEEQKEHNLQSDFLGFATGDYDITDPFGGNLEQYRKTRLDLENQIDHLIKKI